MKLQEAIETLHDLQTDLPQFSPDERRAAVQLGIEALNFISTIRQGSENKFPPLLPGETQGN